MDDELFDIWEKQLAMVERGEKILPKETKDYSQERLINYKNAVGYISSLNYNDYEFYNSPLLLMSYSNVENFLASEKKFPFKIIYTPNDNGNALLNGEPYFIINLIITGKDISIEDTVSIRIKESVIYENKEIYLLDSPLNIEYGKINDLIREKTESILENRENKRIEEYIKNLAGVINSRLHAIETKRKEEEAIKSDIENIKRIAEDIHSDNWDFDEFKEGEWKPSEILKYRLLIRFPHIVIKNSSNQSREIKELYIMIAFDSKLKVHGKLHGRRGELTLDEYCANYGHSHLRRDLTTWQNFCLGSGTPSAMTLYDMASDHFDIVKLQKLLIILHSYVEWESLEGGPYIRMSNVVNNFGLNTVMPIIDKVSHENYYRDIVKSTYFSFLPGLKIKQSNINGINQFDIDKEELENIIVKIPSILKFNIFKDSSNKYFSLRSSGISSDEISRKCREATSRVNMYTSHKIRFKGETVYIKVISPTDKLNNSKPAPPPSITNYVYDKLVLSINNYYLKIKQK